MTSKEDTKIDNCVYLSSVFAELALPVKGTCLESLQDVQATNGSDLTAKQRALVADIVKQVRWEISFCDT